MKEGLSLHEIIYNEHAKAIDYRILDVNPSYVSITGLKREQAIGRTASELYGTGEPPYIQTYAEVAASQQPVVFESYFPPMEKHFSIAVASSTQGKFLTIFTVSDKGMVK